HPCHAPQQVALHQRNRRRAAGYHLQWKLEERRRNLCIDSFVRACIGTKRAAEIEEGLPTDKAPGSPGVAAQVDGIRAALFRRVENHTKEWLSVITMEIGAVRGAHHAVPKAVDDLKLDWNEGLVV